VGVQKIVFFSGVILNVVHMTGCMHAAWLLVCLDPGIRMQFPGLKFLLSKRPKNKIKNLQTHRSGIRLPSKQTVGESRKLGTKKQYVNVVHVSISGS
jgi:hypothetical protein